MSPTGTVSELHPELQALLDSGADFACLMGAQASGKTIYSQYLERCFTRDRHQWSLGRLFALATDGLELCQPELTGHTFIAGLTQRDGGEGGAGGAAWTTPKKPANQPNSRGYSYAEGTTTIKHLKTSASRKTAGDQTRQQSLGVDFIDVPGEWASQFDSSGQRDELLRVLSKTSVFVLFVPFWSLIPWPLVQPNLDADVGGVSLRAVLQGTSARGTDDKIERAIREAQEHTHDWVDRLESVAKRREVHVLIVLSQFQEDVVRGLTQAAVQTNQLSPQLRQWWSRLDDALNVAALPVYRDERVIAAFAHRLTLCRQTNLEMLALLAQAPVDSPTLTALNRLLGFTDRLAARGAKKTRRKMRSVDIFPLNVIRLSETIDLPSAADSDESHAVPMDHRMCYDVLCWLLIQLHGEEVWPC